MCLTYAWRWLSPVMLSCRILPQNNPNAFAMTERQKIEGASAVHLEETRVKMMMAIGQAPPLDDSTMLRHLHEYALEVGAYSRTNFLTPEGCEGY
jgi:hypothetical protein